MIDLSTRYMGLELRNPLIAGSSGLTASFDSISELAEAGVGAVVLKSLFEEDITGPMHNGNFDKPGMSFGKAGLERVDEYMSLIETCRNRLDIPVIASINCVSPYEWSNYAKKIQEAGAHALELNMFITPADPMKSSEENENLYFEILTDVRRQVKLPLAVKISPYFAGMTRMALKLSWTGISGMVLFNRFYAPDIDLDKIEITPGPAFSNPEEFYLPLRWTALLSDRVMCDIAGSTAVYDGFCMAKMILAGARAVQSTSAFYRHGPAHAGLMLKQLETWMESKSYSSLKDFSGLLSLKKTENPAELERHQYLRTLKSALKQSE